MMMDCRTGEMDGGEKSVHCLVSKSMWTKCNFKREHKRERGSLYVQLYDLVAHRGWRLRHVGHRRSSTRANIATRAGSGTCRSRNVAAGNTADRDARHTRLSATRAR